MLTKAQVKKLSLEELQNLALELSQKNFMLERALWGRRSEKLSRIEIEQGLLFNEIEVEAKTEEQEQAALEKEAPLFVQPSARKKPGRRPLPKDLPHIEIIHDITNKTCSHGHTLERIGEDESKKLRVIPMRIEVERHIYPKYVCVTCAKESQESKAVIAPNSESEIITAPREPTLIPRSFATPSLLSYILIAKFLDSLPFYRLERIFSRSDIDLTRATMCRWAIQVAKACVRLRKLLWDELRKTKVLGIDETTVQVLKEPGRKATAQSYMWAYRAETDSGTVILFEYRPSRSGKFLSKRLHNFSGTVMCDGFSGYNSLDEIKDIQVVNCWAHVRRKFFEAKQSGSTEANWFLEKIAHLYRVEAGVRENDSKKRLKARERYSRSAVQEIKDRVDEIRPKTLSSSPLVKAMNYMTNQWNHLTLFLEDGNIPIDNNMVENTIRPFVVGRKNWLFNDSQKGASASAFFYSLIQTAKANDLEPYWYLRYLFEQLPYVGRDTEKLRQLLPMYVDPEAVKKQS